MTPSGVVPAAGGSPSVSSSLVSPVVCFRAVCSWWFLLPRCASSLWFVFLWSVLLVVCSVFSLWFVFSWFASVWSVSLVVSLPRGWFPSWFFLLFLALFLGLLPWCCPRPFPLWLFSFARLLPSCSSPFPSGCSPSSGVLLFPLSLSLVRAPLSGAAGRSLLPLSLVLSAGCVFILYLLLSIFNAIFILYLPFFLDKNVPILRCFR